MRNPSALRLQRVLTATVAVLALTLGAQAANIHLTGNANEDLLQTKLEGWGHTVTRQSGGDPLVLPAGTDLIIVGEGEFSGVITDKWIDYWTSGVPIITFEWWGHEEDKGEWPLIRTPGKPTASTWDFVVAHPATNNLTGQVAIYSQEEPMITALEVAPDATIIATVPNPTGDDPSRVDVAAAVLDAGDQAFNGDVLTQPIVLLGIAWDGYEFFTADMDAILQSSIAYVLGGTATPTPSPTPGPTPTPGPNAASNWQAYE